MITRKLLSLTSLAALFALLASNPESSAQGKKGDKSDGIVHNWGKPTALEAGKVKAFWVWFEKDVWYFRTTGGPKGSHRFSGKIEVVGGKLARLQEGKGETGGRAVDRYAFSPTAIVFDFRTEEGIDGINFKVDGGATEIKFTLMVDNELQPQSIRLGRASDHPAAATFTLPARPMNTVVPKKKK